MALLKTPICDFGLNAIDFKLKSINGDLLTLNDVNNIKQCKYNETKKNR